MATSRIALGRTRVCATPKSAGVTHLSVSAGAVPGQVPAAKHRTGAVTLLRLSSRVRQVHLEIFLHLHAGQCWADHQSGACSTSGFRSRRVQQQLAALLWDMSQAKTAKVANCRETETPDAHLALQ